MNFDFQVNYGIYTRIQIYRRIKNFLKYFIFIYYAEWSTNTYFERRNVLGYKYLILEGFDVN